MQNNRKIKRILEKYQWIGCIIVIICWLTIFNFTKWVEENGKLGYELDNDEKEELMIKQLPKLLEPYKFNKKNVIKTKRGPKSSIYIIFRFQHDDYEKINNLFNTVDSNSLKLGFYHNCRGKEMITVANLDGYYDDPTVNEIPLQRYAVIWEYPNSTCANQSI